MLLCPRNFPQKCDEAMSQNHSRFFFLFNRTLIFILLHYFFVVLRSILTVSIAMYRNNVKSFFKYTILFHFFYHQRYLHLLTHSFKLSVFMLSLHHGIQFSVLNLNSLFTFFSHTLLEIHAKMYEKKSEYDNNFFYIVCKEYCRVFFILDKFFNFQIIIEIF
jgi:hypothetical protein